MEKGQETGSYSRAVVQKQMFYSFHHLFVHSQTHLSIHPSMHASIHSFLKPSSIHLSIHPSIHHHPSTQPVILLGFIVLLVYRWPRSDMKEEQKGPCSLRDQNSGGQVRPYPF